MNKKERSRPATYRDLRQTVSEKFLPRGAFDGLLDQLGACDLIASLWGIHLLSQRSESPTAEDFKRMEAASDYIRQRLPDRLYYAAVLTVMEALPVGLGQDVPLAVIEQFEKLTTILGRKNEWLPKKGRRKGAKTGRPPAADAALEEARRNQVLDAIGEITRESSELDPLKKTAVAQKIGKSVKTLYRWIDMYEWDWEVMEFEGATGHGKEK